MELDDDICLCFHVTKRKIVSFLRVEQPMRLSQLSQCQGAGTGCGWCRPILKKLFEKADSEQQATTSCSAAEQSKDGQQEPDTGAGPVPDLELSSQQYAALRQRYIADGGGSPPA